MILVAPEFQERSRRIQFDLFQLSRLVSRSRIIVEFHKAEFSELGIVKGLPVSNENLNLGGDHKGVRQEPNQRQGGMVLELKHEFLRINAELWAGSGGGGRC